jgi:hypothetical protein
VDDGTEVDLYQLVEFDTSIPGDTRLDIKVGVDPGIALPDSWGFRLGLRWKNRGDLGPNQTCGPSGVDHQSQLVWREGE